MKKLYKSRKFILFNKHRSEKSIRYNSRKKHNHTSNSVKINQHFERKYTHISAPKCFSIVHNSVATIDFLSNIQDVISKNHPLFIDLALVTEITPDAIIYLLILFDEASNKSVRIKGNAPLDSNAFSVFYHSGFYKYVSSQYNNERTPQNIDIMQIIKGNNVDGNNVESFTSFIKKHIPKIPNLKLKALYTVLIESMCNTHEYASKNKGEKNWWTMALHDSKTDKNLFTFADNGLGIPATVRKRYNFISKNDAEILELAVSGLYKMSGSKIKTRNRGLPQMKQLNDKDLINNLVFVSNNGYYSINDGQQKLNKKFTGTLITWELTNIRSYYEDI